jgi:hypothetical protein
MEKTFKLLPPMMPNFIIYDTGVVVPRETGFKPEKNSIPVSALSEQEAIQYAEMMKQEFLKHWRNKAHTSKGKDGNQGGSITP